MYMNKVLYLTSIGVAINEQNVLPIGTKVYFVYDSVPVSGVIVEMSFNISFSEREEKTVLNYVLGVKVVGQGIIKAREADLYTDRDKFLEFVCKAMDGRGL